MSDSRCSPRTIITATPGWELVSLKFIRGIDGDPGLFRFPVIAWAIAGDLTLPVLPWGTDTSVDIETEYTTYRCPDGTVLGGIHEGLFKNLQDFVAACVIAEHDYLEANGRLDGPHPDESSCGVRWRQRQDSTWIVSKTEGDLGQEHGDG